MKRVDILIGAGLIIVGIGLATTAGGVLGFLGAASAAAGIAYQLRTVRP